MNFFLPLGSLWGLHWINHCLISLISSPLLISTLLPVLLCCSVLAQPCLTPWNPLDCSPPDSSVHGIILARILVWVAILFFRGSSWPKDRTWVSCIAGRFFTTWATRETHLCFWYWIFPVSFYPTISLYLFIHSVELEVKKLAPWFRHVLAHCWFLASDFLKIFSFPFH